VTVKVIKQKNRKTTKYKQICRHVMCWHVCGRPSSAHCTASSDQRK